LAQQPEWGLGRLVVDVSRSQTIKKTIQTMGLPLLRDQLITEADTYIIHNKHKRKISGFEPSIQATARLWQRRAWQRPACTRFHARAGD